MKWTEEEIEKFIIENKSRFELVKISSNHQDKFLIKLRNRFKKIISIVPYLIRIIIVWVIVVILSIFAWNSWIRKDRHEITLKHKIENIITYIKK